MHRFPPLVRLILAWVVTLVVLVYAWGRVMVFSMMVGRPELPFVAMLLAGLVGVIWLSFRLATRLTAARLGRWVPWVVAGSWVVVNAALISVMGEASVPKSVFVPLFVLATLWVPWLAWMFFGPLHPALRLGVLVLLLAGVPAFPAFIRVEGLTGDARVQFAWRSSGDAEIVDREAGGQVDLSRIGDQDFPQFLGPRRLGVVPNARLARDWNKTPARLLWRKPVGPGWSGFAVVGDYALTQEQRGNEECTVCYRLADGARVWMHADRARFNSSMGGSGPRATPTIADGRVYTVGATGIFNCLDGATGKPIWTVNILE